ncbi:MAG: DUF4397 domain-containing protein [Arachidicoccus sp.]|nr:DUF4397 domain-containing protein [Arachidicoccus sp.]
MFKNRLKNITSFFVAITLAATFSSCLDHDRDYYNVQGAGVAFINASPGSPDLKLIADGIYKPLPAPFAYDSSVGYLLAYPGYRVFGFAHHNSHDLIASQQFYLKPGNAYSIFIADTAGEAKMFSFEDSLSIADSSNMAFIRFINMSPNSVSLDLSAGANKIFSNIVYGKGTEFTAIAPVSSASFTISENGQNTAIATIDSVELKKGGIYTLWARGYENTNADSLKIGLKEVQNNESAKKQSSWEQ